jgi:hypothetical protein
MVNRPSSSLSTLLCSPPAEVKKIRSERLKVCPAQRHKKRVPPLELEVGDSYVPCPYVPLLNIHCSANRKSNLSLSFCLSTVLSKLVLLLFLLLCVCVKERETERESGSESECESESARESEQKGT